MHFSALRGRRTVPHILARSRLPLLAVVASMVSQELHAAVFSRDWKTPGDGLLTYDDVNQREWLDLTESRLAMFPGTTFEQRYQNALPEFAVGGKFFGFQPATSGEVSALAMSAGVEIGGDFSANNVPVNALVELVGPSYISASNPDDRSAYGLLGELRTTPPIQRLYGELIHFTPKPVTQGAATLFVRSGLDVHEFATTASSGIWMHRPVPEPSSLLTGLLGCLGIGVARMRLAAGFQRPNS
jgi:hypothetical protein